MLTTREDGWPDLEHPSELYLYVRTGEGQFDEERIVILEEGVFAKKTEIILKTKVDLIEWVRVLTKAWKMKHKQDTSRKGWRKR